ncbi:MAG: putative large multifunctional protein-putative glycosyl hydrolase [Acidobacteria bacterium]|jgi:hypothetical protein|nr:putative large multifunctional protein-putative glycosyl hydrolase [Acidobacteriota bacterium]
MKKAVFVFAVMAACVAFAAPQVTSQADAPQAPAKVSPAAAGPFLGSWNIPIPNVGPNGEARPSRNCWLELKLEGDTLTGRFLSGGGSPGALRNVTIENGELKFSQGGGSGRGTQGAPKAAGAAGQAAQAAPPARAPQPPTVYTAVAKDGKLIGKTTQGERVTEWVGVRPPRWPDTPPARKPGKPVELFNGKDMTGWHPQAPMNPARPWNPLPLGWEIVDGAMYNPNPPAANIVSDRKFMDFKLEVEFKVEARTNSGVYLRGRHEIQIEDDYGKPPGLLTNGAIYGFVPPAEEPSRPAGEWQTLEATIVGNRVTIIMNGKKVHDNVVIPAITGGALDTNEGEPGPIMLQGDHNKVYYRKVVITPLI